MSKPPIDTVDLNAYLNMSECHPDSECRTNSWWLYDTRAGMNIGMRAATRDAAFVEGLEYWAKRAKAFELAYRELQAKVDAFVEQFVSGDQPGGDE